MLSLACQTRGLPPQWSGLRRSCYSDNVKKLRVSVVFLSNPFFLTRTGNTAFPRCFCTRLYLVSFSLPLMLLAFCVTKPADSQPFEIAIWPRHTHMPSRLFPNSPAADFFFFHKGGLLIRPRKGLGVANCHKTAPESSRPDSYEGALLLSNKIIVSPSRSAPLTLVQEAAFLIT